MSWTPSSPHQPRDDTRDDTVTNVPIGRVSQPPRFPGFLLAAVIAGLIAFAALGAMLFSERGETPDPSRSPRPTASAATGTTAPGSTAGPARTGAPEPTGVAGPRPTGTPATEGDLADRVCAVPRPPFDQLRASLLAGFEAYCRESIAAVVDAADVDFAEVRVAGWAFTAGDTAGPGSFSHVFLAFDDRARIVRYLVAHDLDSSNATVVQGPTRVSRVADPLMVYRWSRPRQPVT